MDIKSIVERSDTRAGRWFDLFIQTLIVLSLISFTIETLPDLSPGLQSILNVSELAIVIIFTVEYVLRIAVADKKLRFIFSFYGMIDLLAILPFYVARGVDLRSIRVFRLFRLFRIFKLARYNRAVDVFRKAFSEIKEELLVFLIGALFLLYVAAVGIYYFEYPAQPEVFSSVFHALWWAVATLTTVGYGDIYPMTAGGKIFTFFILMVGLGIIAVPTGLIAAALSRVVKQRGEEE